MTLPKTYNPKDTESKIYKFWEEKDLFTPKIKEGEKPFVITLPPPNVTGGLHTGHALCAVEDIMVRYHRLLGQPTLFLPGFDHASIAVEHLVCKQLRKEGKSKKEIGREKFLERARKFADQSRDYIRDQLKKLGLSLDWSREAYTMDQKRSKAVKEAFKRLYQKGLIYQGQRIVNWCPECKSVISDLENEHREQKSKLYYIKYGPLTVATTRPETMFGDTAVAVYPDHPQYQNLVGEKVSLPLTDREIPVIEDSAVDPEFGTGALKITPGHDPEDFKIGQRHHLQSLTVINREGKLTEEAGSYRGLTVKQAREKVVQDLKEKGLLEKVEPYTHSVGHCQRCDTITEPLVSKQWFVKMKPLAEKGIQAVKEGKIEIIPEHFEKVYFHWLENIKDWCISRQLWWGHKIPLEGEDDVLDTWFSSALWPISTLGWPEKTKDFEYFYPTTVRETGHDILFFWVAREIMICLEMTGEIPFKTVYLHGLIRDQQGRKFSKTKGIGFDPLEIIEKYGADALRMALTLGIAPGVDATVSEEKIKGMRNFANKIWNASRFVLLNKSVQINTNLGSLRSPHESIQMNKDDKWILKELDETSNKVTESIEDYRFDLAAKQVYQFFWHKFCDQYIESTKERREQAQPVLLKVLKQSLILIHPFMPFVTEEIYQKLPNKEKESIMLEEWNKT